jgi:hypothetical protein
MPTDLSILPFRNSIHAQISVASEMTILMSIGRGCECRIDLKITVAQKAHSRWRVLRRQQQIPHRLGELPPRI